MDDFEWGWGCGLVVAVIIAWIICLLASGGGWCLAAALAAALLGTILVARATGSGKRKKTALWCAGIFALAAPIVFTIMAEKGISSTVFMWLFWIFLVSDIYSAVALREMVAEEKRKKEEETRKKKEKMAKEAAEVLNNRRKYAASLCSGILLPDTCFLMDLGEILDAKDFVFHFVFQCLQSSFKVTLHRHVYHEINKLSHSEVKEKSKKAQKAKRLIERWQKLGIVQTYPDLEDAEKSYYADDALLKYMGELLQKGEKVRLLTNDLDLRIRARDRFEKLGKVLPEDMLLSLDEILDKWPR